MQKIRGGGYTLMELLVVVLIIGILAATAIPQYFKVVERARVSEAQSILTAIKSAQVSAMNKTGKYTANWSELDLAFADTRGVPCTGAGACSQKTYTYMLDEDGSVYATRNNIPTPTSNYGIYTIIYDVSSGAMTCTQASCILDLI